MSYTLLVESFPVARKAHKCIWCGMSIPVGLKHRHERSIFEGDFQANRWHVECNSAFLAEMAAAGECEMEFSPYENERPGMSEE